MSRRPISSVLIAKHTGRGPQIGAVRHPGAANPAAVKRAEAEERNLALRSTLQDLDALLTAGLARDPHVGVGDWRREPTTADLPADLRDLEPPRPEQFQPEPLSLLARLSPAARQAHARASQEADANFRRAMEAWEHQHDRQADALAALREEVAAHNRRLRDLERTLQAGEADTVAWYAREVLARSEYPKNLSRAIQVALDQPTRTMNVRMGLPSAEVLAPAAEFFRYVKPRDEIMAVERSGEERAALYERIVAQVALRTLHELFTTDVGGVIDRIRLDMEILDVDPGTGHDRFTPLMSLNVEKASFLTLDLTRVDPIACVARLAAVE